MLKAEHPIELEELMAYLDDELDGERAAVAAEHLERCAECRQAAEDLRGVTRALMAWKVEDSTVEIPRSKARQWEWVRRVGGVAIAAAMVFVGVVFNRLATNPSPATIAMPSRIAALTAPEYTTSVQVTPTLRSEGYADQAADIVLQPRQIARTAQLELAVQDFSHTRDRMEAVVSRHHGYVGEMSARSDVGIPLSLTARLQIPSAEFTGALTELRQLGRVVIETQTAEDVTKLSADLDARLANFRISEQRLKDLLQHRTGKLSEVLEVEQQITRVRGEIEQMESQRKVLTHRVDYVAIAVRVTESAVGPASTSALGDAARHGWRTLVGGMTGFAEFILTVGPSLIFWGVLFVVPAGFAWRRWGRRGN